MRRPGLPLVTVALKLLRQKAGRLGVKRLQPGHGGGGIGEAFDAPAASGLRMAVWGRPASSVLRLIRHITRNRAGPQVKPDCDSAAGQAARNSAISARSAAWSGSSAAAAAP